MRNPKEFKGSLNMLTGEYYPVAGEIPPTPDEWKAIWADATYDPDETLEQWAQNIANVTGIAPEARESVRALALQLLHSAARDARGD